MTSRYRFTNSVRDEPPNHSTRKKYASTLGFVNRTRYNYTMSPYKKIMYMYRHNYDTFETEAAAILDELYELDIRRHRMATIKTLEKLYITKNKDGEKTYHNEIVIPILIALGAEKSATILESNTKILLVFINGILDYCRPPPETGIIVTQQYVDNPVDKNCEFIFQILLNVNKQTLKKIIQYISLQHIVVLIKIIDSTDSTSYSIDNSEFIFQILLNINKHNLKKIVKFIKVSHMIYLLTSRKNDPELDDVLSLLHEFSPKYTAYCLTVIINQYENTEFVEEIIVDLFTTHMNEHYTPLVLMEMDKISGSITGSIIGNSKSISGYIIGNIDPRTAGLILSNIHDITGSTSDFESIVKNISSRKEGTTIEKKTTTEEGDIGVYIRIDRIYILFDILRFMTHVNAAIIITACDPTDQVSIIEQSEQQGLKLNQIINAKMRIVEDDDDDDDDDDESPYYNDKGRDEYQQVFNNNILKKLLSHDGPSIKILLDNLNDDIIVNLLYSLTERDNLIGDRIQSYLQDNPIIRERITTYLQKKRQNSIEDAEPFYIGGRRKTRKLKRRVR